MASTKTTKPALTDATEAYAPEVSESTETSVQAEVAPTLPEAFITLISDVVGDSDLETGEPSGKQVNDVSTAYQALESVKVKNLAKAHLQDGMRAAMTAPFNYSAARTFMVLSDGLTVAKVEKTKAPAVPVDPSEAALAQITALYLGASLAMANLPDGVSISWDQVQTASSEAQEAAQVLYTFRTDEQVEGATAPDASPVGRAAVSAALGRGVKVGGSSARSVFTGTRRDVGNHVRSAFADLASGDFLTVAQITKSRSDEYGDDRPSAGAVNARLYPKSGACTLEGVSPDSQDGTRGARKV